MILGGGRMYMTPRGTLDPEYPTSNSRKGDRNDKRNLIDVWLKAEPVRTQRARLSSNHLKRDFYMYICLAPAPEQEVALRLEQEGVRWDKHQNNWPADGWVKTRHQRSEVKPIRRHSLRFRSHMHWCSGQTALKHPTYSRKSLSRHTYRHNIGFLYII